ncbi:hypothetical protein HY990_00510 [Candidatus Micrarchaeota archaeon]|nr:hypothetical protein [Candidatus Micrarchaeota archaeon]
MKNLPVKRIVFYKHGVGHIERRGKISDSSIDLSFPVSSMNDILKSLTVIDGSGKVVCVSYDSHRPTSELMKNALVIPDGEGLVGLLRMLVGEEIKIVATKTFAGKVVSVSEQSLDLGSDNSVVINSELSVSAQLSLMAADGSIDLITVSDIKSLEILSSSVVDDLKYFLELSSSSRKDGIKNVTVVLDNQKSHDLSISYLSEMPIWRVSYRFVYEKNNSLIQGWGIVDNPLQEDLENIEVSLVAGQPVSFVYDFYAPPLANRPYICEQPRAVANAVEFDVASQPAPAPYKMAESADYASENEAAGPRDRSRASPKMAMSPASYAPGAGFAPSMSSSSMQSSISSSASGAQVGSFFKYDVLTPVTIKRGQSSMLPILGQKIAADRLLLYNYDKNPSNPVVSLRFLNKTGLTLERGPLTVFEEGSYAGEAILAFTESGAEQIIAYATELGVKIDRSSSTSSEFKSAYLSGWYLITINFEKSYFTYRIQNNKPTPVSVMVEHPKSSGYVLLDTKKPDEETATTYRWKVDVPASKFVEFQVILTRETSYSEHLQNLSGSIIESYMHNGRLSKDLFAKLGYSSTRYQKIKDLNQEKLDLEAERKRFLEEQSRLRENISSLSNSMEEAALRKKYVAQMDSQETRIQQIQKRVTEIESTIRTLNKEIADFVATLSK